MELPVSVPIGRIFVEVDTCEAQEHVTLRFSSPVPDLVPEFSVDMTREEAADLQRAIHLAQREIGPEMAPGR